jgi:hypothetical protein
MDAGRRRCFGAPLALALVLAGCSPEHEPDEAAIRQAIEQLHQDWVAERLKDQRAHPPSLFPDLAFEASLEFQITSVRKVRCDRAPDGQIGYVCVAVVGASVGGRAPVLENVQGRFVRGGTRWLVHNLVVLTPSG